MSLTVAAAPHVRKTGLVLSIGSLGAIGFATLLPATNAASGFHFCLICGPVDGVNAILNVLLFAPLGLGLALLGLPGKRALFSMCALSVLIETAQYFVIPGRESTIGDVLTNTLGGALGFVIGRYAFALFRPSPRIAVALSVGWSALWLAIQAISAFGFSPALTRSKYYGQIAPRLGEFEQFRGRVVLASIGDVPVRDSSFPDSRLVQERLLRGASVKTTFIPPGPTQGIAPIVRIVDDEESEIVLVAQNAEDLVFGVRTGAAALRLRPPVFALPNVFARLPTGVGELTTDTLTVSARYSAKEAWVSMQGNASHDRRIPITASLGWTMLLPFPWFIEGTRIELVVSAVWIACLLLPIGYWGGGVVRFPRAQDAARIQIRAAPIALVLLYIGLVVVPQSFGLTAAPPSDWLAALTGIISGAALGLPRSLPPKARLPSVQTPTDQGRHPTER